MAMTSSHTRAGGAAMRTESVWVGSWLASDSLTRRSLAHDRMDALLRPRGAALAAAPALQLAPCLQDQHGLGHPSQEIQDVHQLVSREGRRRVGLLTGD